MGKPGGILTIGIGVALLYVAYTGYLASAWNGLQGKCGGAATQGATTGSNTIDDAPVQKAGEGDKASDKLYYTDSPTGGMRVTNAGMW